MVYKLSRYDALYHPWTLIASLSKSVYLDLSCLAANLCFARP